MDELFCFNIQCLQHRDKKIRHGRLFVEMQAVMMLQTQLATACKIERIVSVLMSPAVAAAVSDECSVEEVPFSFWSLLESDEKVGQIFRKI